MNLNINWYPGHMKKTSQTIEENLKQVDLVFELIDARAPRSSKNPLIADIVKGADRILIYNKMDLSDKDANTGWLDYYRSQGETIVGLNAQSGQGMSQLYQAIDQVMAAKRARDRAKGIVSDQVRAMIIGVPNVGKSTLINTLVGRRSTKVGNRPGVTKIKQWVRVKDRNLYLLDTPGVLWPKFQDQRLALHLAYIGSIRDEVLPIEEIGLCLIEELADLYPDLLEERYKIQIQASPLETMEEIGRRRGTLLAGGHIDYRRVADLVLDEFRKGIIGPISLEKADV